MDGLIVPSQESSKSVSICDYLPSCTPPLTTNTVLAATPSLPDRKSGGQSSPCVQYVCSCSVQSPLGCHEGYPFLHTLNSGCPTTDPAWTSHPLGTSYF